MPKRILICNPYVSLGGIGSFTLSLGAGLKNKGDKVYLIATHFKGDLWNEAINVFDEAMTVASHESPIFRLLKIVKLIALIKPDTVIINDCPLVNYSLPLISRKIKSISIIHSDHRRYYSLGSRFSGWIDKIVCPSPKLGKQLLQYLPEADHNKIVVIPHGVKLSVTINFQEKIKNTIIFIGNLGEHKGVNLLPKILGMVVNEIKDASFTVIGKGPLKDWLINEIEVKELGSKFHYISELDKQGIYKKLAETEVMLLPTRLESFGLVIPESMANGAIPVISNLEDITDQFVKNEENGFLCDKDNPSAFAERIITILKNEDLKKQLSESAIRVARDKFSEERMIQDYHSIIESEEHKENPIFLSPRWVGLIIRDFLRIINTAFQRNEHPVCR